MTGHGRLARCLVLMGCLVFAFHPALAAEAPPAARPYVLDGTQVLPVPDPVSGRQYEIFVNLPAGYDREPQRRYPVLYITDADYGFPLIRSIARRINLDGPVTQDFILVGLSYAKGEEPMASRRRDYTPSERRGAGAPKEAVHGGGLAYQVYLKGTVLPFVDTRFRTEPEHRVFMGHSYGGLLGAQILLTEPDLFKSYILGSPSLWFDKSAILKLDADYAASHKDLTADVFFYVGAFEATKPGDRRYNRSTDMVKDLAEFQARLKAHHYPGLRLRSEVLAGENHLTVFPPGFTRGLIATLPASAN